jgi:hypothetical protein
MVVELDVLAISRLGDELIGLTNPYSAFRIG